MKLLTPGTGNQSANRKKAVQYIVDNILDAESYDIAGGKITTTTGETYQVSAYAESGAAFISTPGVDSSKNSIYATGLITLMFRQIKKDKRSFIYEVDPTKIEIDPNKTTAEWPIIDKAASRIWICTAEEIRSIDRRNKN
jgi:hypothetical protein